MILITCFYVFEYIFDDLVCLGPLDSLLLCFCQKLVMTSLLYDSVKDIQDKHLRLLLDLCFVFMDIEKVLKNCIYQVNTMTM